MVDQTNTEVQCDEQRGKQWQYTLCLKTTPLLPVWCKLLLGQTPSDLIIIGRHIPEGCWLIMLPSIPPQLTFIHTLPGEINVSFPHFCVFFSLKFISRYENILRIFDFKFTRYLHYYIWFIKKR